MQARAVIEDPMLPVKVPKPKMTNTGVYVADDVLRRADEIAEEELVKSRNKLLGSFLAFAVDLFPLLKPYRKQIDDFAGEEGCTYVEAVAKLVGRGLRTKK